MTLCIKYNNIDFNKLTLNKKKKFDKNAKVIYYPLNYNYDYNLNKKFYILTDWIELDGFNYKNNKLTFNFTNNDLDILFNKIKNMIMINDNIINMTQSILQSFKIKFSQINENSDDSDDSDDNEISDEENKITIGNINKMLIIQNIDDNISNEKNKIIKKQSLKKSNMPHNIDDNNDIDDSDDSEDSDIGEENKIVKKQSVKKFISKINDDSDEENKIIIKQSLKKSFDNIFDDKIVDYNNLIQIKQNLDNANLKSSLDEIIKYELNFNDKSIIKLIPSKKSGLVEYELNKKDNYTEIKRYFPTMGKKNTNFKIVGKFLLYINVYCIPHSNYGIKIHIKSGELKYDKTFVENDMLKSKGIYDDKIKIEI